MKSVTKIPLSSVFRTVDSSHSAIMNNGRFPSKINGTFELPHLSHAAQSGPIYVAPSKISTGIPRGTDNLISFAITSGETVSVDASSPVVLCLRSETARELLYQTLGKSANVYQNIHGSGQVGVLLYLASIAVADWQKWGGAPLTVSGVLSHPRQIPLYLKTDRPWCLELSITIDTHVSTMWILGPSPVTDGQVTLPTNHQRATNWPLCFLVICGHSLLPASSLKDLKPGNLLVLDGLVHPAAPTKDRELALVNHKIAIPVKWHSTNTLEVTGTMTHITDTKPITTEAHSPPDSTALTVTIQVEIARTRMTLQQALDLLPGHVLELSQPVTGKVSLVIDDTRVATGELVSVGTQMAVEITDVFSS